MSDGLTSYERRLTLGALWDSKQSAIGALAKAAEDDDDHLHIEEAGEAYDSAALELGGDPAKEWYGAHEF